jgi:hypothetical protein
MAGTWQIATDNPDYTDLYLGMDGH